MSKSHWPSYAIVFIASACILILEIVAARILAPYVGVSIYTWTSIIGTVLAGISLGNYCGGLLADRWASRRVLGTLLGLGGLSSLAILPLIELTTTYAFPPGVPLLAKIVVMTAAIFFPPAFILGMVSPVVVKLTLRDLAETGGVVGRIYAFSTLGSILGTYLAGFVLISLMGTRLIVVAVAGTLLLLALAFGDLVRARKTVVATAVASLGLLYVTSTLQAWESGCLRETDFFCIKVLPLEVSDERTVQQLVLDHLVHSYNDVDDPSYLHYGYMRIYGEMTDYVARERPDFAALHIGGGGYTMPRYIEHLYPRAADDVIEIDPGVTEVAYQHMGLNQDSNVRTINADARIVVEELGGDVAYDLVFGDAFNDLSVPYHLTTREFALKLKDVMTAEGWYLINVIDKIEGGRFLASMVITLQTVFDNVYVLSESEAWDASWASTYVLAASDTPLDLERLTQARGQGADGRTVTRVMPPERMETWLSDADSVLLTDDYAPVDNLLAPLFLERGR